MAVSTEENTQDREKSATIGPMRGLFPFIRPYRGLVILSGLALVATAMLSLVLPLAVRRVVDGFGGGSAELVDLYFAAALGIAALLAIGTGLRYYLVTRLGERVVADIREAVYDRMIGMSPAFFERIMTGEVLSRITTDTTLILSVISSSVSVALRNILIFIGGLAFMLATSLKLAGLVLLLVPMVIVPIIVLGRRLRNLSR
ncbi:MAG: ABC transporter transmembrane domain-containing protein, partial [Paracoccaceae bacterium]